MFAGTLLAKESVWPPVTKEARPWGYTWVMGGALDEENLRWKLGQFHDAGLGGMHLIPIYGAKGYEDRYIEFMSPKWLDMLRCAVTEADKLGMGIDMTLGTGWCFGGPMVSQEDANMTVTLAEKDGKTEIVPKYNARAVKRAAPGGEGQMLNPYSVRAVTNYVKWFDEKLKNHAGPLPRAIYHDSYEYANNWSDDLFEQFEKRRGYKLQDEMEALAGKGDEDRVCRVKADYRKTVAEMHLDFTKVWTDWGRRRGFMTRNEAHGGPSNLLDVYAAADVPETEFFFNDKDPLIAKFSSSAAHVSGRKLVASESATWIKEHFHETLGDIKTLFDGFFVSGVNHIFYHGTVYSPKDAPWPGWLFYASTQMNPQNSIWRDAKYLNRYIARCQSVLQAGEPDNDILLYWPVDDIWHKKDGLQIDKTVHHIGWFKDYPIAELAEFLWKNGYQFDYISDAQLQEVKYKWQEVSTPGGKYRAVVVPRCTHMPVATLKKLAELVDGGVHVLFDGDIPVDVPGLGNLERRRTEMKELSSKFRIVSAADHIEKLIEAEKRGPIPTPKPGAKQENKPLPEIVANMSAFRKEMLQSVGVMPETIVPQTGVKLIRREIDGDVFYFISNTNDKMEHSDSVKPVEGWFQLERSKTGRNIGHVTHTDGMGHFLFAAHDRAVLMDPMTGKTGLAKTRRGESGWYVDVYLQLKPNESIIVRVCKDMRSMTEQAKPVFEVTKELPDWVYYGDQENVVHPETWKVEFIEGGPELPAAREISELKSWTEWNDPVVSGEKTDVALADQRPTGADSQAGAEAPTKSALQRFAGTARYSTVFDLPEMKDGETFRLDLGDLSQSARVRFNGTDLGCLFVKPYTAVLPPELLKTTGNRLEIEVTNLTANRIRDLDRNKVDWKIFRDINIVNINYKKFDASEWPLQRSGLFGPVRLTPIKPLAF